MRRLIAAVLICFFAFAATAQSLKVMTYNIRFDNPADGVNAWGPRKEKLTGLLKKYDADIIGVQEALIHQITDITTALPDYAYVGVGRDDGKRKGEYSAILFKKDRFTISEQNTFWLSETPDKPGSKSWDAAITRVATWALVKENTAGREFYVINTHFDHIGQEARKQSAELLKNKLTEFKPGIPIVLTGDFNCTREEDPYKVLTDGETLELIDPASMPVGTFCTFEVKGPECRAIDYIFLTNEWRADGYKVIDDNDGVYYPSDHLPVIITLSFTD
jgi:endonuclease/exonuclease/phosphatase family metal-dependent hydrolase